MALNVNDLRYVCLGENKNNIGYKYVVKVRNSI